MDYIASEDRFRTLMPTLASQVISYVESDADLCTRPFGFDNGMIGRDRQNVTAQFSCVSSSGGTRDHVTVIAVLDAASGWVLSHSLKLG